MNYQILDFRKKEHIKVNDAEVIFFIVDEEVENDSLENFSTSDLNILIIVGDKKIDIPKNIHGFCYLQQDEVERFIHEFVEIENRENLISLCLYDIKVFLNLIATEPRKIYFYTQIPSAEMNFTSGIVLLKGYAYKNERFNLALKHIGLIFKNTGDYAYALKEIGESGISCFFTK